jgi:antitoxin (DNA-binding transcriptional repressor) of toxin-antitoxin stability system
MSLPTLTPEQRAAALAKATEARTARAELLAGIKAGTTSVADVITRAEEGDEIAARTKVAALLKALPGWGPATVSAKLNELGIADSRRVGGLGPKQKTALLDILG